MIMSQGEYDKMWVWTRDYIDHYCLWRRKPDELGIPGRQPGTWYSWQFYLRKGLFNHEFLSAVSQMFLHKMYNEYGSFFFQLAGLETASTPMLAGIPLVARAYGLDINSFSVRKNRKEYGLKNIIEGRVNSKPIIMIDDLSNSSRSFRTCLDYLVEEGHTKILDRVFCIVNKTNKTSEHHELDKYLPESFKVVSLFSLDDFGLEKKIYGKK